MKHRILGYTIVGQPNRPATKGSALNGFQGFNQGKFGNLTTLKLDVIICKQIYQTV